MTPSHRRAWRRRPSPGQQSRCRRGPCRAGVSFVELLLALSILAVIAATLAGMLSTVSSGTRSATELRRRNMKSELVRERIESTVRSSSRVLAVGDHWLVLWAGDVRGNSVPDLSEICRIEWDATARELRYSSAPPGLADADNATYSFSSDFDAITRGLAGSSMFPRQLWGGGVDEWTPTLDKSSPAQARVVSYRLSLRDEQGSSTFVASVAPRGAVRLGS